MSHLTDFLRTKGVPTPTASLDLKLMHTANGEDFVDILLDKQIKVSKCGVFVGEDLAYFFLGRPAYKTKVVHDPSYYQLPAVFIFDNLDDYTPTRIFPFDSGAFQDGRFKEIIGKVDISSFNCGDVPNIIPTLIKTFFSDRDRYVRAQPVSVEDIARLVGTDLRHFQPLALAKLYNHNPNYELDDRLRLVEYQYSEDIKLRSPNLKGVICSKEWLRDPILEAALADLGCRVASYPLFPLNSASYYAKIYELAGEMV